MTIGGALSNPAVSQKSGWAQGVATVIGIATTFGENVFEWKRCHF